MALADIIARIQSDAKDEAADIARRTEAEVAAVLAEAKERANSASKASDRQSHAEASRQAATLLANARLESRDKVLKVKCELIEQALSEVRSALLGLDDDAYCAMLVKQVASSSRGGERLLIAAGDRARLADRMPGALEKAGATGVVLSDEDAPADSGIVLLGDRMRVDMSVDALLAGRSDDLSAKIAAVLFEEGEG